MNSDTPIIIVDSARHTQSFATVERVIAYIRQHPRETFEIYALPECYQTIQEQVLREENQEDYAALAGIHSWKGQMSGWSELDDLNEMREHICERIAAREKRLRYGGEPSPLNVLSHATQPTP
jgi:Cys-tRNA synthase (O-phospho-L-seryl-tRNA:Cys-tRNA synthase)